MGQVFAILYAALAGGLTNIQVGCDSKLYKGLGNPALAAVWVLLAGTAMSVALLLVWWMVAGLDLPKRGAVAAIPWWAWAGGALQGFTLFAVFVTAGRTGSAVFSALTVTGGAVFSIALDHYGLVGFPQHAVNWSRVAGAALLVGGTLLMTR